jgi:hypothetical protein
MRRFSLSLSLSIYLSLSHANKQHRTVASVVTGTAVSQYSRMPEICWLLALPQSDYALFLILQDKNFDCVLTADYLAVLYKLEQ